MARLSLDRINTWWFITIGCTSMASSLLIYILLIESSLGAFSVQDVMLGNAQFQGARIALLNSEYTRQASRVINPADTSAQWVGNIIDSWKQFLLSRNRRLSFAEVQDADIEQGNLGRFEVLILPSSIALSDLQIRNIKTFVQEGGSVMATWTPGLYRPNGEWRGWEFMENVFGVRFVDYVERTLGNYMIYRDTVPGVTPQGIYFPMRFDGEPDTLFADETPMQERMRQLAQQANLPQLRRHRWVDTLNIPQPRADYVQAETLRATLRGLDGELRRRPATALHYYTWMGSDNRAVLPLPESPSGVRRFTLVGNTPLNAKTAGGYRVKVQVYNPGVKVRIVEPRTRAAGFWYDFGVEEAVVSEAVENSTGIAYGTYGRGRFIYMGFQKDAMGIGPDDEEDQARLNQFFANVVDYILRKPIVWVNDWPHRYEGGQAVVDQAGAVIVGVSERGISNFRGVHNMLREQNVPGTYCVRSDELIEVDPDAGNLLRTLHESGDVCVYDDMLTENDGVLREQQDRLIGMKRNLESIMYGTPQNVEKPVTGYRPSRPGMLSTVTMQALVDGRYTYFLPDSIGRRVVPKIMGAPYSRLTRIGATTVSAGALRDRVPVGAVDEVWSTLFKEDITRVYYEGSLYRLIYDHDGLGAPENLRTFRSVINELKNNDFWIAAGDELQHWWRLHRNLNADVEQRSPARVFVRISNDNSETVNNITISIALGQSVSAVNLRPEIVDVFEKDDVPEAQLIEDGNVVLIPIETLKRHQYRIYHLDLLNEDGSPIMGNF